MTLDGAFSQLATLTTERLCLRQMRLSDAEAVFSFKSDPEVSVCYGQEPHQTIEETRTWLLRRVNDYAIRDSIFRVLTLRDEEVAIGECCLWNFDPSFLSAEIGYESHPKYWNKGLMTEALIEVLAYGFLEMGLHRIEARPYACNTESRNLLLKLGFKQEGMLRECHFFRGSFLDQLCYGLLSQEWKTERLNLSVEGQKPGKAP